MEVLKRGFELDGYLYNKARSFGIDLIQNSLIKNSIQNAVTDS